MTADATLDQLDPETYARRVARAEAFAAASEAERQRQLDQVREDVEARAVRAVGLYFAAVYPATRSPAQVMTEVLLVWAAEAARR